MKITDKEFSYINDRSKKVEEGWKYTNLKDLKLTGTIELPDDLRLPNYLKSINEDKKSYPVLNEHHRKQLERQLERSIEKELTSDTFGENVTEKSRDDNNNVDGIFSWFNVFSFSNDNDTDSDFKDRISVFTFIKEKDN